MAKSVYPEGKEILQKCLHLLDDKHVIYLRAYDVRGESPITDYFLVGGVRNERQMKAAGQNLVRQLKLQGIKPYHTDGPLNSTTWVVLDYVDCIIHLFSVEAREFYNIEKIWADKEMKLDPPRPENE